MKYLLIAICIGTATMQALCQEIKIPPAAGNIGINHLALDGYDPVSYFLGKPAKGNSDYQQTHAGITFWFSTLAARDTFALHPEKFVPAYGGWCAYAMAVKGQKVEVDPLTYKIVHGRLLLFYNKRSSNTLDWWNQLPEHEGQLLNKADANWQEILKRH